MFHESDEANESNLKNVEKETDRLLKDLENRLGSKITNCKTKRQAIIESHNNLVTRIVHLEQNLSRIEDQFDTLKMEKDTALVDADNKLVEQTDNTDTLKHLKNTQDRQGKLQQMIRHTQKIILTFLSNSKNCKSFQEFSLLLNHIDFFTKETGLFATISSP